MKIYIIRYTAQSETGNMKVGFTEKPANSGYELLSQLTKELRGKSFDSIKIEIGVKL